MNIEDNFAKIVFGYLLLNTVLYFFEKATRSLRRVHKVLSLIHTVLLWLIVCGFVFLKKPMFVLIPVIVLLFEYLLVWGLCTELSDDDRAMLVHFKGIFPMSQKLKQKIRLLFFGLVTFPIFYFEKTWFYEKLQEKLEQK